MTLPELRAQIDALDAEIIRRLNERADLVHEVGVIKKAEGQAIYAPEREEQVFRGLVAKAKELQSRLPDTAIRAIYREIMSASYALEKGLVIAYFGPTASNTHQAARSRFGASVEYVGQVTIADVFDAVARGQADYGVVPIENSTEGAVSHTLDVFTESDLRICAQILMRIENHLAAKIPRAEIRRLYSHPQVFGQCRTWLRAHLPDAELIEVSSTPRAAELASKEPQTAALVGAMAAEIHGLQLLERSVQDHPNNTTRFLVLGRQASARTGEDRTSIMFSLQDKPGALFSAIEPFKRLRINMSKIESRPLKRKAWEYFFFVDLDGHTDDTEVREALDAIAPHCTFVKVLGSYPRTGPV
jgi:chorismate mutase / prephenate dehydratase